MSDGSYVLARGHEGRERLRLLARILSASTARLLDELGVGPGLACLDVGCGGGDVSSELARRVGPGGRVLGLDLDAAVLETARREAADQGPANLSFETRDVFELEEEAQFDLVYARFLLSHLAAPEAALDRMLRALRPGGRIALEDIDFSGHFSSPECPAFRDYVRLYSEAVRARGGDPDIGPRLPLLLQAAGLSEVDLAVSQPAGTRGEAKLINPITLESIGPQVIASGLATAEEVARLTAALYEEARDERTVLSMPRIVQAWARKP